MTATQSVLMGDPEHFFIRSGSNPHTRNFWGVRKGVDLGRAKRQWHALAKSLTKFGVRVVVLPASPETPGSVFPANAGFLFPKEGQSQCFYLSNLIPGRAGERPFYKEFLNRLGFKLADVPHPFEGEADFIPSKEGFLFTWGVLLKQRFVPRWGFPPYKRLYGFRSALDNFSFLKRVVGATHRVIPLRLVDERFYHGDTLLSPFGPQGEFLMAYLPALAPESGEALSDLFKERLILLEKKDALRFAANGFQVEREGKLHLILPEGLSGPLLQAVEKRGVKVLTVDVSEFSEKGGGSVKCLLCDLGHLDPEQEAFTEEQKHFWNERSYTKNC